MATVAFDEGVGRLVMSSEQSSTSGTIKPVAGGDQPHGREGMLQLSVGAIGIVFDDISPSPNCAFRETFAGHHILTLDTAHFLGALMG